MKLIQSNTRRQALVKFGFRLLYNEMAWSYDVVSYIVSLGKWRSWQQTALKYLIQGRVLEVAYGPGHMLVDLERRGFKVIGIDMSWAMARKAERRLREYGMTTPVIQGAAEELPFANGTFEAIVSTFPTIFIMDQAAAVNFFKILKPGGRLVMVLMARLTTKDVVARMIEWAYRVTGQRPESSEVASDIMTEFARLYEEVGFKTAFEQIPLDGSEVTLFIGSKPERL